MSKSAKRWVTIPNRIWSNKVGLWQFKPLTGPLQHLASGGFGVAAVTVLSWIYRCVTGKHAPTWCGPT